MSVKRESENWLPSTSYVVLGLLSFGTRLTGYEIRQWALESTRFFWAAPAMSQIYRELERLQTRGLVDERDDSGEHDRARKTFGLTPSGLAELQRWVNGAPFEPPTIRHAAAFRLFVGHVGDRARLIELVEEHQAWASEMLTDLGQIHDDLRAGTAAGDDTFRYAEMVAQWGLTFYGGDEQASNDALARLEDDR